MNPPITHTFPFPSACPGLGVNELLYFRVISPEDIGYIFSAAPAKDFGGDFVSVRKQPSQQVFLDLPSSLYLSLSLSPPVSLSSCSLSQSLSPAPQVSSYDEIYLVPAEPADGCSELRNRGLIHGQVILLERG